MEDLKQGDLPNANPNRHNDEEQGSRVKTRENDEGAIHVGDATLQTPEEYNKDKNQQAGEDKVTATGSDDLQSNSDGAAGTDRAGTAERKTYGDTKLNQGLDEQQNQ